MAVTTIRVPLGPRSYPIVVGHRQLGTLAAWLSRVGMRGDPVVVTTPRIWRMCGGALQKALRWGRMTARVIAVPDTERSKSMAELTRVLNRVAAFDGVSRRLFIVALGGGVVGDLAGLVAALYRRGIPYVQIPTTLLAQVDSSIGGKTAVDLAAGKNLVGAFYQPRLVFVETSWLSTLPLRQLASGLAEVIKSGLIRDVGLVRYLESHRDELRSADPAALQVVIGRAASIKAAVVAQDERETTGLRTVLNFGHTIGHAIEAAIRYGKAYTHGEAVAIGMRGATAIARRIGVCPSSVARRVNELLTAYRLPGRARGVRPSAVLTALAHDKKAQHGRLRWVLPTRVGHVVVTPDVPDAVVRVVVEELVGG